MADFDAILSRFQNVTRTAKGWRACCPGHADEHPSLSIDRGDNGRLLYTCRSHGCSLEQIAAGARVTVAEFCGYEGDGLDGNGHNHTCPTAAAALWGVG